MRSSSFLKPALVVLGIITLFGCTGCDPVIMPPVDEFALSYDGNGSESGDVPAESTDYGVDEQVTVLGNTGTLAKDGYVFDGWNTKDDGSGTDYDAGDVFDMPADDVTLHAQWTLASYRITYNLNGGTNASTNPSSYTIADTPIPLAPATKPGYVFDGWVEESSTAPQVASFATQEAPQVVAEIPANSTGDVSLVAQFTAVAAATYSVTYSAPDADSGTVPSDSADYEAGDSVTVASNTGSLAKTGHSFNGWNGAADGTGTAYTAGSAFSMPASNLTLYADWTADSYDVVFDKNAADATGTMVSQAITFGQSAPLTSNGFTRTGYIFAGWNTAAGAGGTTYTDGSSYTMNTEGATLYAQWSTGDFTVSYDDNSETTGTAPTGGTYAFGSTVTVASNTGSLTKTGHSFNGWNSASDGLGTAYAVGSEFSMPASDLTLFADWTANSYDVLFDKNAADATGTMVNQIITFGTTDALNANAFSRTGYTFAGWDTTADGSGDGYADRATFTMSTEGVTLYAQWSTGDFPVDYQADEATSGLAPTDDMVAFNSTYAVKGNTGSPALARTGYTFAGWNTQVNGSGAGYTAGDIFTMPASTVALYADWTANSYDVVFDKNDPDATGTMANQTVTFGVTDALSANTYSLYGYDFVEWNTEANGSGASYLDGLDFTMFTEGMRLYAQWTPEENLVDYRADEATTGIAPTDDSVLFGSTYTVKGNTGGLARTGYTFAGWDTQANGSGTDYVAGSTLTMPASTVVLYADWTANSYDVVFNANGGSGSMTNQTITFDSSAALKSNTFSQTGYSFAGWSTTAAGSVSYGDGASYTMSTVGATLYAQWTANDYDVAFNANGGTGSMSDQAITFGTSENLISNTFSRSGFTFTGWNTAANGGGAPYTDGASYTMSTVGATLYAQWTTNDYDVVFNANGGSGSMSGQAITFGTSENLIGNTFSRTGYAFTGWNTAANGGGTPYTDGASYTMSTEGATLYAQWTANDYDVAFNANGGSGTMTNQTITFDSSAALKSNTFSQTGYSFAGWSTTAAGSVSYTDGTSYTMTTVGATLYAQWTANDYDVAFNANGGTGSMSDQAITFGTSENLISNTFSRNGYTFTGWNTAANGGGTPYTDGASYTMSAEGATLYAIWQQDIYMVSGSVQYFTPSGLTVNVYAFNDGVWTGSNYGDAVASDTSTTEASVLPAGEGVAQNSYGYSFDLTYGTYDIVATVSNGTSTRTIVSEDVLVSANTDLDLLNSLVIGGTVALSATAPVVTDTSTLSINFIAGSDGSLTTLTDAWFDGSQWQYRWHFAFSDTYQVVLLADGNYVGEQSGITPQNLTVDF